MLTGGCFCGAVRYEAGGTPFDETNCHCSICRRTTGAPFVTWFSVRRSDFRVIKGEPARFTSTEKGRLQRAREIAGGTDGLWTLRWREMDSNFSYRRTKAPGFRRRAGYRGWL